MTYLFIISLLLTLSSCHEKKAPPPKPPVAVTVMTIEPENIPAVFEYVGVAQSSHLVEIRARVEGYLDSIAYKEGSMVQKGDLLFQLDPKPFIAALDRAKGEQARQEAMLWQATRSVERYKPLYEQKAASLRDLDNATASQMASEADVLSAKAKVYEAELNLGYTHIETPVTGLSSQSVYREGALITPGPNSLMTTVSVIDPIWVNFSVSENNLLKAHDEQAKHLLKFPKDMNFDVELVLADGSTFPHKGKVDFTDPSLDQRTGTMNVRAVFPNPEGLIKPYQFVKAKVLGAERPQAIAVPQKAVLQGRKRMYVYVVDEDNKAAIRDVVPGDWFGDYWVINSGLQKGDVVIIDGTTKVQPGAQVKTSPAKLPSLVGIRP